MIRVNRTSKPRILAAKEAGWRTGIQVAVSPGARAKAQNKYRHKKIKDALIVMFHGKCAYCESRINHIDYGHIEHFKPKSLPEYYELAVDWSNLLLACGRCNGPENKGVKFPGSAEGGPLVSPTEDDPAIHFRFDFDTGTKLANVLDHSKRGKTTLNVLGLNRRELLHHRSDFVKKLWAIATYYDQDADARLIIDAAIMDDAEYAAFAREVKRAISSNSQS